MTFVEKHRYGGGRGERAWLTTSWEGEIFGVGMFEAMADTQPEHADEATACATMEWFNIHRLEEFGHAAGVHVSLEQAEKTRLRGCQAGAHALVRTGGEAHDRGDPGGRQDVRAPGQGRRHARAEGLRG
jgi:hypothetical protein